MERQQILTYLSRHVSQSRLQHCLGVESAALNMADKFGVPADVVTPAALLHDLCREYPIDSLLNLAVNFGIVIDDIERAEPMLLHGSIAAELARQEFGLLDRDILEAITFHITGAAHLSRLAQLIFVADFIEPGRTFEFAKRLRADLPLLTADQLLLKVYNHTICYVTVKGYLIHFRSIEGRNELLLKGVQ